jgi:hypothetical protein
VGRTLLPGCYRSIPPALHLVLDLGLDVAANHELKMVPRLLEALFEGFEVDDPPVWFADTLVWLIS